jgi:hypothetical protein
MTNVLPIFIHNITIQSVHKSVEHFVTEDRRKALRARTLSRAATWQPKRVAGVGDRYPHVHWKEKDPCTGPQASYPARPSHHGSGKDYEWNGPTREGNGLVPRLSVESCTIPRNRTTFPRLAPSNVGIVQGRVGRFF